VSKLHDTSSAGHAYSAAGTHLHLGNTNVSVTYFIDDSDDSDICVTICLICYKFSNVRFVICSDLSIGTVFMMVTRS